MKGRRRTLVVGLCAAAVAVGATSVAWACTPNAHVAVGPAAGDPGSQATVTLRSFHVNRPVEVRWESATGVLLQQAPASATGGSSVRITVPDVPGGVYYVVGVQFDDQRNIIGQNSASFEVHARPAPPAASPTAPPADAPSPPATDPVASPPAAEPAPSPATQSASPSASAPAPSATPAASPAAPAALGREAAPARPPAPVAGARTSAPSAVAATTPPPGVPAGDTTTAVVGTNEAAVPSAPPGPSRRSATADLWSGLDEGSGSSLTGPSLTSPVGAQRDNGGMAVGVVLLTLGLAGLTSGFGLAVVRRRRAPAGLR